MKRGPMELKPKSPSLSPTRGIQISSYAMSTSIPANLTDYIADADQYMYLVFTWRCEAAMLSVATVYTYCNS